MSALGLSAHRAALTCARAPVSVETDFFAAGGNSLQAVRLITRLKKEFEVTADYVALFQEPTVRTIAACCSQRSLLGAAAAGLGSLLGRAA